jgi:SAM-dependent methyltransferase
VLTVEAVENDTTAVTYRVNRAAYWDDIAKDRDSSQGIARHYHERLKEIYGFVIPPGRSVLEIGCGFGDLLASVNPRIGVGVDLSPEMIRGASERHTKLTFICGDVHRVRLDQTFEYVILSDLLSDLWNIQEVFERIHEWCQPDTRIVLNTYSRLWEIPLGLASYFNLARPLIGRNWLTVRDVENLLHLSDFELIHHWEEVLWPVGTPVVESLCNKCLVKLWPFRLAALSNFFVARPRRATAKTTPTVTIVVPVRNEAGNIDDIFKRVPEMGSGTELIFVEGGSSDKTYETIQRAMTDNPDRNCKLFRQTGTGKGDAVRLGFANASGDIFMILDADLTVAPEDLVRFYNALASGNGEFINGVRLLYPMEDEAMRIFNLIGNKFFSLVFSWLLGQNIKDTLCGTKVLARKHYELIAENRDYFGDFDPFGDFDLIFGAAKLNMRIVDLPVRYRKRLYGKTNIRRWRDGLLLLRMAWLASRRLKFV